MMAAHPPSVKTCLVPGVAWPARRDVPPPVVFVSRPPALITPAEALAYRFVDAHPDSLQSEVSKGIQRTPSYVGYLLTGLMRKRVVDRSYVEATVGIKNHRKILWAYRTNGHEVQEALPH